MELVATPASTSGNEPDLMSHFISNGALTMRQSAKVVHQIADALYYLNTEHSVMHRDLKPDNVLVGAEGFDRIRVADYGHSRMFQVGLTDGSVDNATLQVGTLGYSAPEVIETYGKGTYDARIDVWSLGCIAYMCAVCQPAFPIKKDIPESVKRRRVLSGKFEPMTGPQWSGVDQEFKELIVSMLQKKERRAVIQDILGNHWLQDMACD